MVRWGGVNQCAIVAGPNLGFELGACPLPPNSSPSGQAGLTARFGFVASARLLLAWRLAARCGWGLLRAGRNVVVALQKFGSASRNGTLLVEKHAIMKTILRVEAINPVSENSHITAFAAV